MDYFVKSIRVSRSWFGTKLFYCPMKYEYSFVGGNYHLSSLKDDMPTVWGYETEAEAWAVIDQQIAEDEQEPEQFVLRDSGREDFHSDG